MRIVGRRYDNGQPVWIELSNGTICDVGDLPSQDRSKLPWLAPGLVDLQVNGYGGLEFTDPNLSSDDVQTIARGLDCTGVTGFLATVTTQETEALIHSLQTIAQAIRQRPAVADRILGIHLEGPYISSEDGPRGAHPTAFCKAPDWDEFLRFFEAAAGYLRIVTLSPEYPNSASFIERVAELGVLVAIGHTNADTQQIRDAVAAGARLSTHLGNGAHAWIRRHPNYIWDQLAEDELAISVILDGHHLPPSVVKCFLRVKSPENVVLISDITAMGGLPPGKYNNWKQGAIEVLPEGIVRLIGQENYLAGAALPLTAAIGNLMEFTGIGLAAAVDMASTYPARLIGLPTDSFRRGSPANLIQFHLQPPDNRVVIQATINAGQCVYGQWVTA